MTEVWNVLGQVEKAFGKLYNDPVIQKELQEAASQQGYTELDTSPVISGLIMGFVPVAGVGAGLIVLILLFRIIRNII